MVDGTTSRRITVGLTPSRVTLRTALRELMLRVPCGRGSIATVTIRAAATQGDQRCGEAHPRATLADRRRSSLPRRSSCTSWRPFGHRDLSPRTAMTCGKDNASQRAFCRVIRGADSPVLEEVRERRPTLEHVVNGLGNVIVA